MYKIMIIEDDMKIAEILDESIKKWGFQSYVITEFADIISQFNKLNPHLIILDVSLPYFDGYHWCHEIRKLSNVPIIFVSSHDADRDAIMAISLGGDDYITKPFKLDIVIAKIRAILRRTYDYEDLSSSAMVYRGAVLDSADFTFSSQSKKIELTKNEFRIFSMLLKNKGKIVSREKMTKYLWDNDLYIDENTLTVNVGRLRKKLETNGFGDCIETKKGVGYMIRNDESIL